MSVARSAMLMIPTPARGAALFADAKLRKNHSQEVVG